MDVIDQVAKRSTNRDETMPHCIMKHRDALDETICSILSTSNRIAIVGLSDKPWRDSHRVASYLLGQGYDIVPVNPYILDAMGIKSYPDLISVPGPIDLINVFRRIEHISQIVEQVLQVGAKAIWTQYGLTDESSAEKARRAGLRVVMNRCIMVEHSLHFA